MVIVIILFTIFIKEVCVYSVYEFSLLVNTTSKVSGYFRKFMKKKRYSEMDKNYFGHGTLFIELPVMSRPLPLSHTKQVVGKIIVDLIVIHESSSTLIDENIPTFTNFSI